ncbi:MAG: GNAT family N-acetyltransferase [Oscillospiraceae bacterium]|nr:GNAT family N-acetyltransferase [Oscillospiraceae bacterium]
MQKYFEKISGERVFLSPMNPDDYELATKWLNDSEVATWLGGHRHMYSLPAERAWMEENVKKQDNYQFAIVLRDGQRYIGGCGLNQFDATHRRATLGIFIGEADDRNCGYGAEALRLLVDYSFRWLGLQNIDLGVWANNTRAIRCYEKVGFREYGRRTGVILFDGEWQDEVRMEILAKDWLGG